MCGHGRSIVVLLTGALVAACAAPEGDGEHPLGVQSALVTDNGLSAITGLTFSNGLTFTNGLSLDSGLLTTNNIGSASELMATEAGRTTLRYLVRCALPPGRSISKADRNGTTHTFTGSIGVAPEWEAGLCDVRCQERVSACMMAHVNTSGRSVGLWIVGESSGLGWGYDPTYPFQEGAFFGNIFVSPPAAYYCNGRSVSRGTVPGRLGAEQPGSPYRNPFADPGACQSSCVPSSASHSEALLFPFVAGTSTFLRPRDGYTSCATWNHVVTVYRDFDAGADYKICNEATRLCLGVRGGSTDPGALVDQYGYTGQLGQRFRLTRGDPGYRHVIYTICVPGTRQCLTVVNGDVRTTSDPAPPLWSVGVTRGQFALGILGTTAQLAVANDSMASGARIVVSTTVTRTSAWAISLAD